MRVFYERVLTRARQCRHGAMAYHPRDSHAGRSLDLYGEWEESELSLLGNYLRTGQVAVDVGANAGTHSIFFAERIGSSGAVLAFEPQRVMHRLLCANFALNGHVNGHAVHAAVG